MKSVELKLLIEGVGAYTFEGEVERISGEFLCKEHGGDLLIPKDVILFTYDDIFDIEKKLLKSAIQKYPAKNISVIINYRETN